VESAAGRGLWDQRVRDKCFYYGEPGHPEKRWGECDSCIDPRANRLGGKRISKLEDSTFRFGRRRRLAACGYIHCACGHSRGRLDISKRRVVSTALHTTSARLLRKCI